MRNYLFVLVVATSFVFGSCNNGQTQKLNTNLTAIQFAEKIKEMPSAPIIDVRTADEYSKGHLQYSKNINWNSNDFQKSISTFDKSKPILVYCLSGGRSSSAANQMRADGFKEVYELSGGIMNWRAANLPETTDN